MTALKSTMSYTKLLKLGMISAIKTEILDLSIQTVKPIKLDYLNLNLYFILRPMDYTR